MSGCGISTVGGAPSGSQSETNIALWAERNLGDLVAAPAVNLASAVPANPTVDVPNATATADQVASSTWTSNAGDATPAIAQGTVVAFGTDGASGLVLDGAAASTLMQPGTQQAPHIWTSWAALLGETPRAGVDYAFLVMYSAENLATVGQATGPVVYWPADGSTEPNFDGSPAVGSTKRLAGWLEVFGGNTRGIAARESTTYQAITGAYIPADANVWGLLFRGGSYVQAIVGVSNGLEFPTVDSMTIVPGLFLGASQTFPARPYLTPGERVAIAAQQVAGGAYNVVVPRYQVLSRGGRTSP